MTNSVFFFFSSRRRHTRCYRDWSSDVCSSDLSLRWSQFAQIKIPLPSLEEQAEINAVLEISLKEVALLKDYLRLLAQQKRGLMQKLLTGEWRVKVADTEAA